MAKELRLFVPNLDRKGTSVSFALLAIAMWMSAVSAEPLLRHEDPELVRPELSGLTAVHYVPQGSGWRVDAREVRVYDSTGHLTRHEHRKPNGALVVSYELTWNGQGRLASRRYTDHTKRIERREFTYKEDAQGRIVEKIMRDPSKPVGEFYRYEYTWEPDGSRTVRSYRHYPREGPYPDGSEAYDARGRLTRSCSQSHCEMIEYDGGGAILRIREQNQETHHYRHQHPTYDGAGKLATRTIGNIVSHFTWNARGDVAEILETTIPAQGGIVQGKTVYTYKYR